MSRKKPQHTKQFKLDAINYKVDKVVLVNCEILDNYLESFRT